MQKKYSTDTLPYRKRPNKGQKPQYYVENSHDAIISKDIYDKAQKLLAARKHGVIQHNIYPLTGKKGKLHSIIVASSVIKKARMGIRK